MPPIETRRARIERERQELHLRPWQLAPSQVTDDDPSPWPEGTMGAISWAAGQRWRVEIHEKQLGYFACEARGEYWIDDTPTGKAKR